MGKRKYTNRNNNGSALMAVLVTLLILIVAGIISLMVLLYLDNKGVNASAKSIPNTVNASTESAAQTQTLESSESVAESSTQAQSVSAAKTNPQGISVQTQGTDKISSDPDYKEKKKVLEKFSNLGIITGVRNYLNMRKGPSTDTDMVGLIFKNCAVDILEESDGWYKIESGGAVGYVSGKYVTTGEDAEELALESMAYRAEVLEGTLDVYTEPDENSSVLTSILKGEHYDVLDETDDWVNVSAVEGLSGYVKKSDVSLGYVLDEAIVFSFDGVSELRQNIIRRAFDYYGGAYVWGGTELGVGVDCSGFTMKIYEQFGISLYRNSYTQAEQGVQVDETTVKPGDLLFYVGRIPGQIGHVAIYIGNDKIIHAASESKGICVSNWKYVPIVTMRNVIGD